MRIAWILLGLLCLTPLAAAKVTVAAQDVEELVTVGEEAYVLVTISETCGEVFAQGIETAKVEASGFPTWMTSRSNTVEFSVDDCDQGTGRVTKSLFLPINATVMAPAFTPTTMKAKGTAGSGSATGEFQVEVDFSAQASIGDEVENLTGVGWFNLTVDVRTNGDTHLVVDLIAKPEGVTLSNFPRFYEVDNPTTAKEKKDTVQFKQQIQAVVDPELMRRDTSGERSIFPEFNLTFRVEPRFDDGKWEHKGTTTEITLQLGPTDEDLARLAPDESRDRTLDSDSTEGTSTTTTAAPDNDDDDGFVYTPPEEDSPLPVALLVAALAVALLRRR